MLNITFYRMWNKHRRALFPLYWKNNEQTFYIIGIVVCMYYDVVGGGDNIHLCQL